ncbi:MAG: DUF1553 domain-containing protein [Verrucomicrobiae bacterium]|nr:DUF1553 domain-containing protein [Verrucomicrobiae bacterium]
MPWLRGAAVVVSLPFATALAADSVDFNRDIKPILTTNCVRCHGPDEDKRKADLRLDTFEGATEDLGGYRAIDPGKANASEVVARIKSADPDELMPPPKSGHELKAEEISLLEAWINSGAKYERHWAFVPPTRPEPPADAGVDWAKNAIDHFVMARLEKEGLHSRPEASPEILLRRLTLDLTGLPPQPQEVRAFVSAWEKASASGPDRDVLWSEKIDELLKRPSYGERWAAPWLDLARYADSMGYASDNLRTIWAYRDWVIDALNRNLPYDQFTLKQLAGDLLPDASVEDRIATAFHRSTMNNTEGGTDNEEFRVAAVKDRVNTTIQVWMGLTMRCAECHTHKYDPITQAEYYRFYDFFNQTADADTNDDAPTIAVPGTPEIEKRIALQSQIDELHQQLEAVDANALAEERRAWEAQYRGKSDWRTLSFDKRASLKGATITPEADGSLFVSGPSPKNDTYQLSVAPGFSGSITGFRLETIPDPRNPAGGAGRSPEGRFFLNRFAAQLDTGERAPKGRVVRVTLPGKKKFLHLAEVEVFSGKENVARKGTAKQISTGYEGPASNAIDGITDGNFSAHKTTHTAEETNPWWEVDLGSEVPIDRIVLWNRTDGGTASRIEGYTIQLLDGARRLVWEETGQRAPEKNAEWALSGERQLHFATATADFSTDKYPVSAAAGAVSRNLAGWDVTPRQNEPNEAVFVLGAPVEVAAGDKLTVTLNHDYNYGGQLTLGRFRISLTSDPSLPKRGQLPPDILRLVDKGESERTEAEAKKLADYFRGVAPSLSKIRTEIASLQKKRDAIKTPTVPVMAELPAAQHRETRIQVRGNFMDLGDKVIHGVPAAFHPFPKDAPENRIGVAEWLMDPANPLTARVAVNRLWAQLFGLGLVETEEDFGSQGTFPSHPQLLDWLAVEYRENGWDQKALLKTIVMSATYRQDSSASPEQFENDPLNVLLARGPRFRLDAEQVRDQALALSGLLAKKVGGPSVYPPQPPGMWRAAFNGADRNWKTSEGEDRYRRGLYTFWRRSVPYPSMATFDAPSREVCNVRRIRTNTPLQAFVTLNDPVYVEIAQALARRILAEGGGDDASRIDYGLRLVQMRPPNPEETQTVNALLAEELAHYRAQLEEAKKLATGEVEAVPEGVDVAELAAWTSVANILLNLDSVLTKS